MTEIEGKALLVNQPRTIDPGSVAMMQALSTEEFALWLEGMARELRRRRWTGPLDWDGSQTLHEWLAELPTLT